MCNLLLFARRIASRLSGSVRARDIGLVKGILSQLIFTGIIQGYQHFKILFAHVNLQSKYRFFHYSSNGAFIRKSTVDGRL